MIQQSKDIFVTVTLTKKQEYYTMHTAPVNQSVSVFILLQPVYLFLMSVSQNLNVWLNYQ